MAPGRPPGIQAPPGLPSPWLAARGSAAAVQSGAPTGLRTEDRSSAPREPTPSQRSPPVLRSPTPALPATPVPPRVCPAQGSRGTAGHDTQPTLRSKRPPAARSPAGGRAGSSPSGPRGGWGAACALPGAAAEPIRPRGASMRPGPAGESLPAAGSAGPFLFLRCEHVRGQSAEVTVTEERREEAAAPPRHPLALAHAGGSSFPSGHLQCSQELRARALLQAGPCPLQGS